MPASTLKHGETDSSLHAGDLINNRYLLVRELGTGSVSEVWLAHDIPNVSSVAVKFINQDIVKKNPSYLEYLVKLASNKELQEVESLLVPSLSFEFDGRPCFVMPFLADAVSLEDKLHQGPIRPSVALEAVATVAEILGAIHSLQIIHSDVKPSNILVVEERFYLIDFGMISQPNAGGRYNFVGNPRYFPPYLYQLGVVGGTSSIELPPPDHHLDFFALGVTLFDLLTGASEPIGSATERSITAALVKHSTWLRDVPITELEELTVLLGELLSSSPSLKINSVSISASCSYLSSRLRSFENKSSDDRKSESIQIQTEKGVNEHATISPATTDYETRRADAITTIVEISNQRGEITNDGLRGYYKLRHYWSPFLMAMLAATSIFQAAFICLVGTGQLPFTNHEVFLNAAGSALFLQIAGMGYIVVRCLFPSKSQKAECNEAHKDSATKSESPS